MYFFFVVCALFYFAVHMSDCLLNFVNELCLCILHSGCTLCMSNNYGDLHGISLEIACSHNENYTFFFFT